MIRSRLITHRLAQIGGLFLVFSALSAYGQSDELTHLLPKNKTSGNQIDATYQLVWSDDFNGDKLDLNKWEIQTGDGTLYGIPGWGNNELQYYTPDNIRIHSGNLVITARAGDSPDPTFPFTSARIRTQGKFDFTYGRVEARIKVPKGLGLWAAFWMLGSDPSPYGAWPAKGEIDIMESFGREAPSASGAVHYGSSYPNNKYVFKHHDSVDPTSGFHQYAVEWDSQSIRWFIDGEHYYTVSADTYWNSYLDKATQKMITGKDDAPFNANQHILINMAVGGNPAGKPDPSDGDVFPAQMLVDYVRVYQCPVEPISDGLGCEGSIDSINASLIPETEEGIKF